MNYEEEYLSRERQEIVKIYGVCNDDTIKKFINSGLGRKFHDKYLEENHICSLGDEIRDSKII